MFLRKIIAILFLVSTINSVSAQDAPDYIKFLSPDLLTYDELRVLSENPNPGGVLADKVHKIFNTPIISNEAFYSGAKPHRPKSSKLGEFMRVVSWNIEKSIHTNKVIPFLTEDTSFAKLINPVKAPMGSEEFKRAKNQWLRLRGVDVFILQEMEIGMKRSGYLDTTREMAKALNMNYAYAPQYLEVDPVVLGLEKLEMEDGSEDVEAQNYYQVDPAKYKGVFGSAVLSRYPIKSVDILPLQYQPYDWHGSEKKNISFLEKTRRFGAKTAFKNEITREMKVGGRGYFKVDLDVPGLPNNTLSIVNIHLEIKCQPKDRKIQMEEILGYIKDIKNPVIVMGDFNAAPTDISPTNLGRVVKRTVTNPTNAAKLAVNVLLPQSMVINASQTVSNVTKNFNDPFATDVKVIAPNKVKPMFKMIQNFKFSDGTTFDFRGDKNRSMNNNSELLSNSNERGLKGFKTTFSVKRALGIIGKYRLDWAFVKSGHLYDVKGKNASYQFAPHFGETLEELNTSLAHPLSDHHPNVIDLPFEEPKL